MTYELPIDQPFDLERTLRCGQGHRWRKDKKNPGWYTSVLDGDMVGIRQVNGVDGRVEFRTSGSIPKAREKLSWQFRLDDNVTEIYRELRDNDWKMDELITAYRGLRVMRVCPWECLVFFALAGNTSIGQVHDAMDILAENLGDVVGCRGRERYTFPDASAVAKQEESTLRDLNGRLTRLVSDRSSVARQVAIGGIDLNGLGAMPYAKVIPTLDDLHQISDKSANCVALFAIGHLLAFPVDTHISYALEDLYFGESGFPLQKRIQCRARGQRRPTPSEVVKLRQWSQARFGRFAGYASQFLFAHNY